VFRRRAFGYLWFSYSDEVEGGRGARNEKRLPCRTHEDQRMSQGRRLPNPNPTYTYVGPGLYSKRATTVEEGDTTLVESTEYGEYNNTNNSVINAAIGDIVDQPIFFLCPMAGTAFFCGASHQTPPSSTLCCRDTHSCAN
jgi:hypothetical protein